MRYLPFAAVPGMDVNARIYQRAMQTLGVLNGQELPPKRKLPEDLSRRAAKAARPSTFMIEPVLLKQLDAGRIFFV